MSERVRELLLEVRRASLDAEGKTLQKRFPSAAERSLQAVQKELVAEIASSLGKVGRKLQGRLDALQLLLGRLGTHDFDAGEIHALRAEFLVQRKLAQRHLRDLMIQREALGWRDHRVLRARFPIPEWPSDSRLQSLNTG